MTTKKVTLKDITPKKTTAIVKGGSIGFGNGKGNDNITLVRGAKPKIAKDLPSKQPAAVKGGRPAHD